MSGSVPCNYCGIDDATVVFAAGVAQLNQIVRCNRCGLMYASPRAKEPDHIEIAQYDPDFNPLRRTTPESSRSGSRSGITTTRGRF